MPQAAQNSAELSLSGVDYPRLSMEQLNPVISDTVPYRALHHRILADDTLLVQMTHESIAAGNDGLTYRRLRGEPEDEALTRRVKARNFLISRIGFDNALLPLTEHHRLRGVKKHFDQLSSDAELLDGSEEASIGIQGLKEVFGTLITTRLRLRASEIGNAIREADSDLWLVAKESAAPLATQYAAPLLGAVVVPEADNPHIAPLVSASDGTPGLFPQDFSLVFNPLHYNSPAD